MHIQTTRLYVDGPLLMDDDFNSRPALVTTVTWPARLSVKVGIGDMLVSKPFTSHNPRIGPCDHGSGLQLLHADV